MKLDKKTHAVLKNFAGINQSIVFPEESNVLRTCSIQKTIVASAEIDQEFPKQVGIYDLNQFLATISLFDEPKLDFKDKYVLIKSGKKSSRYYYTDPQMIMSPPDKDLELPETATKFTLPSDVKKEATKAASVLQVENVVVVASEKGVKIVVRDNRNKTSNTFEHELEEFEHEGDDKEYIFRVDNLKMLDLDYEVELTTKGISHFKANEGKVQYWVATEKE